MTWAWPTVFGEHQQEALVEELLQLNWQEQTALQLNSLLKAEQHRACAELPEAQWLPRRQVIDALLDVADAAAAWRALEGSSTMTTHCLQKQASGCTKAAR